MKADYANWVSKWIPLSGGIAAALFAVDAAAAFWFAGYAAWYGVLFLALAVAACAFAAYMAAARSTLSYEGGGVQGKVLDGVLSYLDVLGWSGEGSLLEIGCGSGAMSIKAAKHFPDVKVTGIDYWGAAWDYSKKLCENNARAEGVSRRTEFVQGDAADLPFPDGAFDAVVSNFVFHEVKTQPDKLALVREALRVVKPGGYFVFEDVFFARSHYGDIHKFVKELKPDTEELHFVDMRRPAYAPAFLNTPLVLGQMGLLYGRK
ncbi:MAG: class I SAM-dependent methyltransferase [Oscillospiraceae bacterium]|jgi:SAM-dependent methyltransferase|nr:class I SAM-dependent methyltransferase [Oscillospiraceae bacterium]